MGGVWWRPHRVVVWSLVFACVFFWSLPKPLSQPRLLRYMWGRFADRTFAWPPPPAPGVWPGFRGVFKASHALPDGGTVLGVFAPGFASHPNSVALAPPFAACRHSFGQRGHSCPLVQRMRASSLCSGLAFNSFGRLVSSRFFAATSVTALSAIASLCRLRGALAYQLFAQYWSSPLWGRDFCFFWHIDFLLGILIQ